MGYSKSFPRETSGSTFPRWEEVRLTFGEEHAEEERARKENTSLMKQCLDDAASIMRSKSLQPYQSDIVLIATTLLNKRASHVVYWKDNRCKEKFDRGQEKEEEEVQAVQAHTTAQKMKALA